MDMHWKIKGFDPREGKFGGKFRVGKDPFLYSFA
jgi:hypothetical protein